MNVCFMNYFLSFILLTEKKKKTAPNNEMKTSSMPY